MKKLHLVLIYGILVVLFITGCVSQQTQILNEEPASGPPAWVENFDAWDKDRKAKGERGGTAVYYTVGFSEKRPNNLPEGTDKGGKKRWSKEEARNEARQMASDDVAAIIDSRITSTLQVKQFEKSLQEKGKASGISEQEIIMYGKTETDATVENLRFEEYYFKVLGTGEKGNRPAVANQCWVLAYIPEKDIETARVKKEKERQRILDSFNLAEEVRKKENERMLKDEREKEEKIFNKAKGDFKTVKAELDSLYNSMNDRAYRKQYDKLIDIRAELRSLDLTKRGYGNIKEEEYLKFVDEVQAEIDRHSFVTRNDDVERRLQILVETQENQLARQENRLRRLERSQNVLSSNFRPTETKVASINIFVANTMVSNFEFMSFKNTSVANRVLKDPVVSISWNDAALYCNWLSRLYGYSPVYTEAKGGITGEDKTKNGFRLPDHNEIIAMLEAKSIDEDDFEIGIWASGGTTADRKAYTLSKGSGTARERLMPQSFNSSKGDKGIGFRMVRNSN